MRVLNSTCNPVLSCAPYLPAKNFTATQTLQQEAIMELIDAAAWIGLSRSTCCIVIILSLVSSGSLCQRCFKSILTQCRPFHRYVDYLLDALRRRELFMWLELQPATFWHTLLFRFACDIIPSATASAALRISRDYSYMLVQLTHFC